MHYMQIRRNQKHHSRKKNTKQDQYFELQNKTFMGISNSPNYSSSTENLYSADDLLKADGNIRKGKKPGCPNKISKGNLCSQSARTINRFINVTPRYTHSSSAAE